jgi:MoxR-like ATPase
VLAYLADDPRQGKATPWLAARLCEAGTMLPPPYALLRWRMVAPLDGASPLLPATPFQADPAVLGYVLTGEWIDRQLDGIAAMEDVAAAAALPVLHPVALDRLLHAASAGGAVSVDLLGAEGVGRRILAAQFCAATDRKLLSVDCAALAASATPDAELTVAAFRMARASAAAVLLRRAERLADGGLPADLSEGLDVLRAVPADAITRATALAIRLEKPSAATRRMVWDHLGGGEPPQVVTSQRLTPGEIALVAAAAPAGEAAVRMALRRTAPPDGDLLQHLPCPYEWDDLVLTAELRAQLREFETQIRLRWDVYENWGFGKLAHLGQGVAALFAGPSGAGKTMAAQVIARALDLDLWRVDLAGVVNKYIGETEKRLREVFAFGERAGVVLFFDEADALFGNRTQVKDSHDRFANIEIDYLLQRIERFDGIAILATNRKGDIDTAFLRRLRFVIDFVPPAPPERLAIWRKALPEASPSGEPLLDEIDWELLADRLQLTGADIKAAALSAAFLARSEGGRIGMRHVLAAAQREMAKRGQVLRLRPTEATGT